MNTKKSTSDMSDEEFDALVKSEGLDDKPDYGIITSGSCVDQKAQEKFDKEQKDKPPQEFES